VAKPSGLLAGDAWAHEEVASARSGVKVAQESPSGDTWDVMVASANGNQSAGEGAVNVSVKLSVPARAHGDRTLFHGRTLGEEGLDGGEGSGCGAVVGSGYDDRVRPCVDHRRGPCPQEGQAEAYPCQHWCAPPSCADRSPPAPSVACPPHVSAVGRAPSSRPPISPFAPATSPVPPHDGARVPRAPPVALFLAPPAFRPRRNHRACPRREPSYLILLSWRPQYHECLKA
jgi:hypothetical protein